MTIVNAVRTYEQLVDDELNSLLLNGYFYAYMDKGIHKEDRYL